MPMIRHPLAGGRLEMIKPDPGILWERLRKGGVTILAGTPRLWNQMMEYFQTNLQSLPSHELEKYISVARELRVAHVGGGMPHQSLLRFWREDLRKPLTVAYGATELGGRGLKCTLDTPTDIEVRGPLCCSGLTTLFLFRLTWIKHSVALEDHTPKLVFAFLMGTMENFK